MSTIIIQNPSSSSPPSASKITTSANPKGSTTEAGEEASISSYTTAPTLTPPSTLLPASALALKATSSQTTSNISNPTIETLGPVAVPADSSSSDDDDSTTSSKNHKKKSISKTPRIKNGYIPRGYVISTETHELVKSSTSTGDGDEGDMKTGEDEIYHAYEDSISTTREKLEGGGKRTVWVKVLRNVTVRVESGKTEKEKGDGGEVVKGGVSAKKARREARRAG